MSNNEIVWLDGREDPSFVVLRNNDDSHYFYWPFEISLPPRTNDVEPVKVVKNYVLSRYHYHGLTIWINPYIHTDKPIADFARNFHTPKIIPHTDKIVAIKKITDPQRVTEGDPFGYIAFRRVFKLKLERMTQTYNNPRSYQTKLVQEIGEPLNEITTLFDADFIRRYALELILIGPKADITKLVGDIKQLDYNLELTADSIVKFFNFT